MTICISVEYELYKWFKINVISFLSPFSIISMTMQWQMCYTLLCQHIPFESVYISTEIVRLHIKVILFKKKSFFHKKSMVIMANRPLFKLDLQHDLSLGWLADEVQENLGDYRIASNFNVSFPTIAWSPTFHKTNVQHTFGIKYWIWNPVWVKFQGAPFTWILKKKYDYLWKNTDLQRLRGRLKLCLLAGIGWFQWKQDEKVAHFAWFGEPWVIYLIFLIRPKTKCFLAS